LKCEVLFWLLMLRLEALLLLLLLLLLLFPPNEVLFMWALILKGLFTPLDLLEIAPLFVAVLVAACVKSKL